MIKFLRYLLFTAPAVLPALLLPLLAQPAAQNQSPGFVHPPIHVVITPDAARPTGMFPLKMRTAYGFNPIRNYGKGQIIAIGCL